METSYLDEETLLLQLAPGKVWKMWPLDLSAKILGILFLILYGGYSSSAQAVPTSENWKLSARSLEKAAVFAFSGENQTSTDALIVFKNGTLVFEKYGNGYDDKKKHRLWSITKSFVNALFGIAVKKKLLDLSDSAASYLGEIKNSRVKIRHLLEMTSGLKWSEDYSNIFNSSTIRMLYRESDMGGFSASLEQGQDPGKKWLYSSGTSNVLMKLLKSALPDKDYQVYPWKELFEPLGIKDATWETDRSGVFVGSSYLFLTARDLAKFGLLYLQKGKWKEVQLFDKEWETYSKTIPRHFFDSTSKDRKDSPSFGAHFWINAFNPNVGNRPWRDAPETMYGAFGHWGQQLFILPEQQMVVVRLGRDSGKQLDRNKLIGMLIE